MWILVKAFPQPSQQYEETVCCAGITEDGREMLRLYPIRYRRLNRSQKFDRYDLVALETFQPTSDPRPESVRVIEDSIAIIAGRTLPKSKRFKLWLPFVANSLEALQQENIKTGRSLGIICPDPASVRFSWKAAVDASEEERENLRVGRQVMLLEQELTPLQKDFTFFYTHRPKAAPLPNPGLGSPSNLLQLLKKIRKRSLASNAGDVARGFREEEFALNHGHDVGAPPCLQHHRRIAYQRGC